MLSEITIKTLQRILKEDYGREVNEVETYEIAHTLMRYFDLLEKTHLENEPQKIQPT